MPTSQAVLAARGLPNLRAIDLNLLVTFEALIEERHVSRAARVLGLSQPAVSTQLARLRSLFGDDLLVRHGPAMQPTPRALSLLPEVKRVLRAAEGLFIDPQRFDPATTERRFRLRLSDVVSIMMLPTLLRDLETLAPGLGLESTHLGPDQTIAALERDDIDIAVSTGLRTVGAIESKALWDDEMVCVMRKGHPAMSKTLTVERFAELSHVRVAQSPLDDRFVDAELSRHGLERKIQLRLPHWLVVPAIVEATDLIAVLPRSLAGGFQVTYDIDMCRVPLEERVLTWRLYWHRRYQADMGNLWLREKIDEACSIPREAKFGKEK